MSISAIGRSSLRSVLPFKAVPEEVPLLRRRVRSALEHWGALVAADEAELAVTELATNVIKHVGENASATLVVEPREEYLRLELHDTSHAVPNVQDPGCQSECGRGLHLLTGMGLDWGALLTATGKAVWCEIPVEPSRPPARIQRAAALLGEYRRAVGTESAAVPTYAVLEESVTDMIADLLHWLSAQGGDPDGVLDRAQMHFESEVGEPGSYSIS
ncbi:ATP-binding protein [Streptomyces sp. NPDC006283]|uniref:ATP-binding protein n=1 Tax=Streptomyces sp. NPDC006283 TaxID=3156741 RepID=UPI0033A228BF